MSKILLLLLLLNVATLYGQSKNIKTIDDKNMGAFGINNFDNDDAIDWLNFFLLQPSSENLDLTFGKILKNNGYIEVDDCNHCIVASEILAALNGKISPYYPDDAKRIKLTLDSSILMILKTKAMKCLIKIRSNSELKELYMDNKDNYKQWLLNIDGLVKRLN